MSRMRSFVIVVLGVMAVTIPAAAQDWKGQGRIEGRVLDPDGKPVAGAVLKLELVGRGTTTTKTDKNGRWALGGIAAGLWNIDIEAPGYKTKKASISLAGESVRLPPAEVRLEKDTPKGPPPEVLAAIKAGDDAFQAGKYAEARAEYEKLLALRPDLGKTLHLQIARCYDQEKNYGKELEHLEALIAADPSDSSVKLLAAQVAINANQTEKGMTLLKGLDDTSVKDPAIFFNIAALLLNQQKPEEAVAYLGKSIAADPSFADGYFQRGLAYLGLQKNAEARADLQKFLELAPSDARADMAKKAIEQLPK